MFCCISYICIFVLYLKLSAGLLSPSGSDSKGRRSAVIGCQAHTTQRGPIWRGDVFTGICPGLSDGQCILAVKWWITCS